MSGKLPFLRTIAIFSFNDELLFNPYSRTRDGVRVGTADLAISKLNDHFLIGQNVLSMLQKCKDNIPDDYTRKAPSPAIEVLLKHSKLKSWRAFHTKSLLVDVKLSLDQKTLTVTPWQREGGGATAADGTEQICGLDPVEIDETVLLAFRDAK